MIIIRKKTLTKSELMELLDKHGINWRNWGQGEAKTIDDLWREIENQETNLIVETDGKLRREVSSIQITIWTEISGRVRQLVEDHQTLTDGRERHRDQSFSCGEKMRPGEMAADTAIRCLKEELKIFNLDIVLVTHTFWRHVGPRKSMSYPGLLSFFTVSDCDIELPPNLYQPEGYVEVQPDKTTYFRWIDKN